MAGIALGVAALIVLVTPSLGRGDPSRVAAFSIYAGSLMFLYLASTLYHAVRGRAKIVLQRLDHIGIYLLIAGSYTPFTLVVLRGPGGWTLFWIVWALALCGITLSAIFGPRVRVISYVLYLLMGWLAVVVAVPLVRALSPPGAIWMLAGGVAYTGGFVLFTMRSLRHNHEIWHVLVLLGSLCHFIVLALYVA